MSKKLLSEAKASGFCVSYGRILSPWLSSVSFHKELKNFEKRVWNRAIKAALKQSSSRLSNEFDQIDKAIEGLFK